MKDVILQILPLILTAVVAALGRRIAQWIARSTYAVDVAAVRTRAAAVAADVQRTVDTAKASGTFTPELSANLRTDAIARVKRLEPLAVKSILTALGGDEDALNDLIGGHVEEAVRSMRSTAPKPLVGLVGELSVASPTSTAPPADVPRAVERASERTMPEGPPAT